MKAIIPLLAGATWLVSIALAAEVRITLPPEMGTLRDGRGLALVQTSCLTCHSAEYISTQPPFPRAFWEASVKKMREKYGAPVAEGDVGKLVDYLAAPTARRTDRKRHDDSRGNPGQRNRAPHGPAILRESSTREPEAGVRRSDAAGPPASVTRRSRL